MTHTQAAAYACVGHNATIEFFNQHSYYDN